MTFDAAFREQCRTAPVGEDRRRLRASLGVRGEFGLRQKYRSKYGDATSGEPSVRILNQKQRHETRSRLSPSLKSLGFLASFYKFRFFRKIGRHTQPLREILGQGDARTSIFRIVSKDDAFSKECVLDLYRSTVLNAATSLKTDQCIFANSSLFLEVYETPFQCSSCHPCVRGRQHIT